MLDAPQHTKRYAPKAADSMDFRRTPIPNSLRRQKTTTSPLCRRRMIGAVELLEARRFASSSNGASQAHS